MKTIKKIPIILSMALSLFLVACNPSYDFSSGENLRKSAIAKGVYEGYSEEEAASIYGLYAMNITLTNLEGMGGKSEKEMMEFMREQMEGKSIADLQTEIKF